MNIICTIDILTRHIALPAGVQIASYDHNVDVIQFNIEPIEDFSLDTSSIKIAAQGPNNVRHDYAVDPSTVQIEEETGYITFDWPIPQGVTEMPIGTFKYGDKGQLIFAVCAEIIDGSTVSKAWHSDDGIIAVVAHLEPESGGGEDPSETATNAQKIAQLQTDVAVINTQVGALGNGSPTPVSTVAEMTDESAVYLYTGSETGYTAGNWYFWDGSAWTSGGTYGGAVTDTTLSISGSAADAKAVGDALAEKADSADVTALDTRVTAVEDDVSDVKSTIDLFRPAVSEKFTESKYGTSANNYYRVLDNAPVSEHKYIVQITAENAGSHTFQIGIAGSASSMRDTFGTFTLSAGQTIYIDGYTPSGSGYTYCRNTAGDGWNIVFYEIYDELPADAKYAKDVSNEVIQNALLIDGATIFENKVITNSGALVDETGTMAWMPRIKYPAGTIIKLSDYTHQRMYVKYWTDSIATANVHESGWITSDYTLPAESYVGVSIKNKVNDTSAFTFDDAYRMLQVVLTDYAQKGLNEKIEVNKNAIQQNASDISGLNESVVFKSGIVKGINHRGYNTEAPQNTIPAFVISRKKGFSYVETDVRYTSDGIPVLLHDFEINYVARNADGSELSETVYIADITYEQALQYVFCGNFYAEYPTQRITTFRDFVVLCRNLGLHPYIEIKSSAYNASVLVDIVKSCGMLRNVTWICFDAGLLGQVKTADAKARLGLLTTDVTSANITSAQALKTADNDVFISASSASDANVNACVDAGIPLEIYTLNDKNSIVNANPYVSGITSDTLVANDVLYQSAIG